MSALRVYTALLLVALCFTGAYSAGLVKPLTLTAPLGEIVDEGKTMEKTTTRKSETRGSMLSGGVEVFVPAPTPGAGVPYPSPEWNFP